MYIHQAKNKDGIYYSFSYMDEKTGKRTRLKRSHHPYFTNYDEALAGPRDRTATRPV
jgi:hypothetical protein